MDIAETFNRISKDVLVAKFRPFGVSAATRFYRNMFISIFEVFLFLLVCLL